MEEMLAKLILVVYPYSKNNPLYSNSRFCTYTYVTISAKTEHVRNKTEITFIAQEHSYTQQLSMHSDSTVQCKQVCFSGGHFADPVMSRLTEWRL